MTSIKIRLGIIFITSSTSWLHACVLEGIICSSQLDHFSEGQPGPSHLGMTQKRVVPNPSCEHLLPCSLWV
jgi:hypothetical protein